MMTVLLVTPDDALQRRFEATLEDVSLFVASTDVEAIRQLRMVDIDIAVRPVNGRATAFSGFAERARSASPRTLLVAVVVDQDEAEDADFVIRHDVHDRELKATLRHLFERRNLARELDRVRLRSRDSESELARPEEPRDSMKLVREFTRVFTAALDLPRTLETFTDAVVELLRPARLALLLPDAEGRAFRVRVHRGLTPQIASSIRLPADGGLCHWLTMEGRPARVSDLDDPQVAREVALLQGAMAVPLMAAGELVAVLVVGPPVVRSVYANHEVETLFDLATHLAPTLHAISLHHRLQRASEFKERILESMSSGVVTIGADERVITLNRRGAEILELDASAVVGQDLRVLPSPLGDMLYETLTSGQARPHAEIRLARRGLWLEVSTYPVRGDDAAGAVLVFEDRTAQKELAAQKREAEQFELLTRVIARVADEVKNPLVSINTFMELIGERFDDPEFRRHFSAVVGRDVRRLVQAFEKLTGLVTQAELNFSTVDLHSVVEEVVVGVQAGEDASRPAVEVNVSGDPAPVRVKVDPGQLRKALAYLVWYLVHHSPERPAVSLSVKRQTADGADDVRIVIGSRTAAVPVSQVDCLFDPVRMVQESLIDIGPAVSQRIVEALGGRLEVRHGQHDVSFVLRLPPAL
ncbi:MAG TPA: GAF domain-containing protein [Candidatus Acidoferrum sp.]|nr:GAF domain-containing protein [Candidatus Acidoferrum sp.]